MGLEDNLIPKRDEILESFSAKFRAQELLGAGGMGQEKGREGVRYAIEETLNFWDLDSLNFYLNLEDKLRQSKNSYNSKRLKLHYQTILRIAMTAPRDLTGYRKYIEERGTNEVLLMSTVIEFWLSKVNTFGSLYEVLFQSLYSRTGKAKLTLGVRSDHKTVIWSL